MRTLGCPRRDKCEPVSTTRKLEWSSFATAIAQTAGVPAERIEPGTRLLEDLGLDSLALSEVIVLLLVDFEMFSLEQELSKREWRHVTVGELFQEYQRGQAPPSREHVVIRTQPRR